MPTDLTIIIPAYNAAGTIGSTIESALKIFPESILVINDGSNDDTAEIASLYEGCSVISQENSGSYSARQRGINLVKTKYCILLDADDQLNNEGALKSLEIAETQPHFGAVAGAVMALDPEDNRSLLRIWKEGINLASLITRGISPIPPGAILWRTTVLSGLSDSGPVPLGLQYAEDYELLLRAASQTQIHQHDKVSLFYSLVGGKSSKNPTQDNECAETLRRYYGKEFGVPVRRRSPFEVRALGHLRQAFELPGDDNRYGRWRHYILAGLSSPPLALRLLLRRVRDY